MSSARLVIILRLSVLKFLYLFRSLSIGVGICRIHYDSGVLLQVHIFIYDAKLSQI